jgi:hypothetical protein
VVQAAVVSPVTSFQVLKRLAISLRYSSASSRLATVLVAFATGNSSLIPTTILLGSFIAPRGLSRW